MCRTSCNYSPLEDCVRSGLTSSSDHVAKDTLTTFYFSSSCCLSLRMSLFLFHIATVTPNADVTFFLVNCVGGTHTYSWVPLNGADPAFLLWICFHRNHQWFVLWYLKQNKYTSNEIEEKTCWLPLLGFDHCWECICTTVVKSTAGCFLCR